MFPWKNKDVQPCLILLLDIGNTHTHLGLANSKRVFRQANIRTAAWKNGTARRSLQKFLGRRKPSGAALCSVVPQATPQVKRILKSLWSLNCLELRSDTATGVGIRYPSPNTIGPDPLATPTPPPPPF